MLLYYDLLTWAYSFILGGIALLFAINTIRYRGLSKQFLGIFILLPVLLRCFLIK